MKKEYFIMEYENLIQQFHLQRRFDAYKSQSNYLIFKIILGIIIENQNKRSLI